MRGFFDKRTANKCRIYTMLKRRGRHLSFHTPGHKRTTWDITELSFSDNLRSPKGCIALAEREIAEILGAKRSFLLTDGSSAGVRAMLYAAKRAGVQTIAVPDNAHESFFTGCELLGLTPLVYPTGERAGIPYVLPFVESVTAFPDLFARADALWTTSPTYYGQVVDLAALRAYCDEEGKLLLVDGAHGGHLHFEKTLYAGSYAHLWVDGVHKSLPALTQGAVVSSGEVRLNDFLQAGAERFRTTSPSYPIMASVEYAVRYPRNRRLENAARAYANACPRAFVGEDWTKLCARFGAYAFQAATALEKRGIYPEFCDGEVLLFYLSPATTMRAFKKVKRALSRLFKVYPYEEKNSVPRNPAPLLFRANAKIEWVDLQKSEGRICAQPCGLFPPCAPLLRAGEKITKTHVEKLLLAPNTYGLCGNTIGVYEEDETR